MHLKVYKVFKTVLITVVIFFAFQTLISIISFLCTQLDGYNLNENILSPEQPYDSDANDRINNNWEEMSFENENPEISTSSTTSFSTLSKCKFGNSSIERLEIDLSTKTLSELSNKYSLVKRGGLFKPSNCTPHSAIAIIVPYRDRSQQLPIFLNHMHQFLQRQQLEYGIYIIEQSDSNPFNRGMLMNIGYLEVINSGNNYDCFIFHDVDLLPEVMQNFYGCGPSPRHYCVGRNVEGYKLPYPKFFGGVSSLTTGQFKIINGFSNSFWGWGGEDDDFYNRVVFHNFTVVRYSNDIGRYFMLSHEESEKNPERFKNLKRGKRRFNIDGLNSIFYNLKNIMHNLLYTNITVELSLD